MVHLKGCPRCGGDIHINRDMYGEYRECLQCGLIQDIEKPDGSIRKVMAKSKKRRAA